MRRIFIVIYMSIFSFITPVGIAIGIALTFSNVGEYQSPATAQASSVLNCLAAGTLIYVVFFEILEKERLKKSSGLLQVLYMFWNILIQLFEFGSTEENRLALFRVKLEISISVSQTFVNCSNNEEDWNKNNKTKENLYYRVQKFGLKEEHGR